MRPARDLLTPWHRIRNLPTENHRAASLVVDRSSCVKETKTYVKFLTRREFFC